MRFQVKDLMEFCCIVKKGIVLTEELVFNAT